MQTLRTVVNSLYLFSAPYGSDGRLVPGAKVRTVPNCLLFHQTPKGDKQKRTQKDVNAGELAWIPLQSDENGLLFKYEAKLDESAESAAPAPDPDKKSQYRFTVQPGQTKLRVQMLPLSDVNAMMAAWGPQEWNKKIAAILGPSDGLEAQIQSFEVEKIEDGAKIAKGQRKLLGLVLPRFRTLLVTFSSKSFEDTSVALERVDRDIDGQLSLKRINSTPSIITESETCVAPFCMPESGFQNGFYRIIFDVSTSKKFDSIGSIGGPWRSAEDPKSSKYELTAYLDFPLKSPVGDMQIVNGDPISLEEWLIQQYPDQYALYRFRSIKDPTKSIEANSRTPDATGALTIAHIANTAAAVSKWTNETLSGSSRADLFWSILDAVKSSGLAQADKKTQELVNLALTTKNLRDKLTDPEASYNEIRNLLNKAKEGQDIPTLKNWFTRSQPLKFNDLFKDFRLEIPGDEAYNKTWASRLQINKRHFAQWKRATKVAGKLMSIQQTVSDFSEACENIAIQKEKLEAELEAVIALVRDYHIGLGYLKAGHHQGSGREKTVKIDQFVEALAKPVINEQVSLHLNFGQDKWEFGKDDVDGPQKLDEVARTIKSAGANLTRVIIEGHTSSPGCSAYNQDLSEKRAETVRNELKIRGVTVPMDICAYGESRLIRDASGQEDQQKSRRVVINIAAFEEDTIPHYLACREAMKNLTLACDGSIAARLGVQEAWGKLVSVAIDALYDTVALVLRMFPLTALAGNAMVLAKETYELADAAATTGREALELIGVRALSDALQYLDELQAFCDRSTGNHILLRDAAARYLDSQAENDKDDEAGIRRVNGYLDLQLRMRYEAVNGLMGLLKRAANETDSTPDYQKWLQKHKVETYIQKYLLNDNWLMPTKHFLPISMDEFWLHNVAHQHIEGAFQNQYAETLFKLYYDDFQLRQKMIDTVRRVDNASHGFYNLYNSVIEHASLPDMAEAHAQRLYPLHYISSKDLEEFSTLLKTDSTEINDQSIAHTAIYFQKRHENGWTPVGDLYNGVGGWKEYISPLYPICIVIIMERYETLPSDAILHGNAVLEETTGKYFAMKDGKRVPLKNGYYPYTLKQHRYDGWNVEGLSYSGLMKPLTRHDLPDHRLHHWLEKPKDDPNCPPRLGAVIYPFFQYGPVTYQGTRPILSDNWFHRLWNTDLGTRKDILNAVSGLFDKKPRESHASHGNVFDYLSDAWKYGHFSDMRYGFELRLGKSGKYSRPIRVWGKEKDWVRSRKLFEISADAAEVNYGDEYPVNINFEREHEVPVTGRADPKTETKSQYKTVKDEFLLLDADFLRSGKAVYDYPRLFKGNVRTSLLFRFGKSNGKFVGLSPAFFQDREAHPTIQISYNRTGRFLDIQGFDWRESLECAVVVSCDDLDAENYQSTPGDDSTFQGKIPFKMRMDAAADMMKAGLTKGPDINTTLYYLGYADTRLGIFKKSGTCFVPVARQLVDILSKFASADEDERARALHILGVSREELSKTAKRHVFCAYHSFVYQAPTGKQVDSLRPFGKGHLDENGAHATLSTGYPVENFFFFFSDLQSRDASGVEKHDWNRKGQKNFAGYPSFLRINHPKSFLINVPWMEVGSKDLGDSSGKSLEDRAAENDSIDMGVAKYAETPAMRWARLKTKEDKIAFIKNWMEDKKMATTWNQDVPSVVAERKTSQE